jgi:L-alanine-DL-glutamate epimerase-like enolase superfamily enzyme
MAQGGGSEGREMTVTGMETFAVNPIRVVDGYMALPARPGLRLELNEAALARKLYRQFPMRPLRRFDEEGR